MAVRRKDIIAGRAEKCRGERVGAAWGSYLGVTHSSRAEIQGAERFWAKLRDEMGKGVRGQIIMDFVFLPKS